MADTIWPATLPQRFLTRGLQEQPQTSIVQSDVSKGPPKRRRRFTRALRVFTGVMIMTEAQVETLDAFFYGPCAAGAKSFEFLHPRTSAPVLVLFKDPPAYADLGGGVWEITLSFQTI
jgi:hypothetical protein